MAKSTKLVVEQRILEVYDLILDHTPPHIIQDIFKEKYGLSKDGTNRYITKAKRKWIERDLANKDQKILRAQAQLRKLYWRALQAKQYGTCLKIQQEMNTLDRLYDHEAEKKEAMTINFFTEKPKEEDGNSK